MSIVRNRHVFLAFVTIILASSAGAQIAAPTYDGNSYKLIRPYEDGADPTATFRVGRIESTKQDVFGIGGLGRRFAAGSHLFPASSQSICYLARAPLSLRLFERSLTCGLE